MNDLFGPHLILSSKLVWKYIFKVESPSIHASTSGAAKCWSKERALKIRSLSDVLANASSGGKLLSHFLYTRGKEFLFEQSISSACSDSS